MPLLLFSPAACHKRGGLLSVALVKRFQRDHIVLRS
ncbi:hypothetical protein EC848_3975 [Enterobacter sp. BIGb0359]|nr:hypothetical protein EC848_3975 [Enterobacter sp. BIGb0359]